MIKCYTVPEIWYVMDVIIFHFGPFFALLPNSPKNSPFTLPPPPFLTGKKIKIIKKWKKMHGDVIILHTHNKNCDQMIYGYITYNRGGCPT